MTSSTLRQIWDSLHTTRAKDDPDERLRQYKIFFKASDAGEVLLASSIWMTIALDGVHDVWSVIRKLCVGSIARFVDPARDGRDVAVLRYMHLRRMQSMSKAWYQLDGLLLLLQELWRTNNATSDSPLLCEKLFTEEERLQLAISGVLPLIFHEQLAIRSSAVLVLKSMAAIERKALISILPTIIASGFDSELEPTIEGALSACIAFPELREPLLKVQRNKSFSLASHPAASVRQRLADLIASPRSGGIQESLRMLDRLLEEEFCASSVSPSFGDGRIVSNRSGFTPKMQSKLTSDQRWKVIETFFMALHIQLTAYCASDRCDVKDTFAPLCSPITASPTTATVVSPTTGSASSSTAVDPASFLPKLRLACASSQFEIRRMAEQVTPLVCQYVVRRYSAVTSVTMIARALHRPQGPQLAWYLMLKWIIASYSPALQERRVTICRDIERALASVVGIGSADVSTDKVVDDEERRLGFSDLDPSVKIILTCYFPGCASMATRRDWEAVLTTLHNNSGGSDEDDLSRMEFTCRFAMDFALISPIVAQVVPLWAAVAAKPETPAHVQLVLVEAIRNAILSVGSSRGQLMFATNDNLRAPCLLDGGDDVIEGFFWLTHCVPTSAMPVKIKKFACRIANPTENVDGESGDTATFESLAPLFFELLPSQAAEPAVVSCVLSLVIQTFHASACDTRFVVQTTLRRLQRNYPSWRDKLLTCARPAVAKPTSKSTGNSFDDSDEDEDDPNNQTVSGHNATVELERARQVLRTLNTARDPNITHALKEALAELDCTEDHVSYLTD